MKFFCALVVFFCCVCGYGDNKFFDDKRLFKATIQGPNLTRIIDSPFFMPMRETMAPEANLGGALSGLIEDYNKRLKDWREGTLTFKQNNKDELVEIKLRNRGRSRITSYFHPPLKIKFYRPKGEDGKKKEKSNTKTVFKDMRGPIVITENYHRGQVMKYLKMWNKDRLKAQKFWATLQNKAREELIDEYLNYELARLVKGDLSYRARLAKIEYINTIGSEVISRYTQLAILLEDSEDVEDRMGMKFLKKDDGVKKFLNGKTRRDWPLSLKDIFNTVLSYTFFGSRDDMSPNFRYFYDSENKKLRTAVYDLDNFLAINPQYFLKQVKIYSGNEGLEDKELIPHYKDFLAQMGLANLSNTFDQLINKNKELARVVFDPDNPLLSPYKRRVHNARLDAFFQDLHIIFGMEIKGVKRWSQQSLDNLLAKVKKTGLNSKVEKFDFLNDLERLTVLNPDLAQKNRTKLLNAIKDFIDSDSNGLPPTKVEKEIIAKGLTVLKTLKATRDEMLPITISLIKRKMDLNMQFNNIEKLKNAKLQRQDLFEALLSVVRDQSAHSGDRQRALDLLFRLDINIFGEKVLATIQESQGDLFFKLKMFNQFMDTLAENPNQVIYDKLIPLSKKLEKMQVNDGVREKGSPIEREFDKNVKKLHEAREAGR